MNNFKTYKINKTSFTSLPGTLQLVPDFQTWGPFTNGHHYSTGTITTRKGSFVGYYANVNGNILINI